METTSFQNAQGDGSGTNSGVEQPDLAHQEKSTTLGIVEKAEKIVRTIEEKEKILNEKIKYMEELLTRQIIGGTSYAGKQEPIKTKEEIEREIIQQEIERLKKNWNIR